MIRPAEIIAEYGPFPEVERVTGVTRVDCELWHGTWDGEESDLRRVDPGTGEDRAAAISRASGGGRLWAIPRGR